MKRVALFVLLVTAGAARADLQTAEALEREATLEHDPVKFEACAGAYLAIANQDPTAAGADRALYNAAHCYIGASAIGAAVTTLETLRTQHPTTALAGRALPQLAQLYTRAGRFADAAQRDEEYAKRYAGEKDAIDAIQNAIVFRVMLGQRDQAIEDSKFFVKTFGAKRPREAADAMFQLLPLYDKPDDAIRHIESILRTYPQAGEERLMIAQAKLGELLWDKTCPQPTRDGLCIAVAPRDKVKRCGEVAQIRVVKRTETKVAEAALLAALKRFERATPAAGALHAYAMTKLRIADRELEAYLAVTFPTGLDFSSDKREVKEASLKRFNAFVTEKQKLGGSATRRYEEVLSLKDPIASVAAAARIGQLTQNFYATLNGAEIPKDVRTGDHASDKVEAFCSAMTNVADPLRARALEAYGVCLQKSIELSLGGAWSRVCRRGRAELEPLSVAEEDRVASPSPLLPAPVAAPLVTSKLMDLAEPLAKFAAADAAAWTPTACRDVGARFGKLATVEAAYMRGVVHERCRDAAAAARAYDQAIAIDATYAPALANLAALRWRASDRKAAIELWERAYHANAKLAAPHVGLALAHFDDPREAAGVESHILNAIALDDGSPTPFVLMALVELRRDHVELARYYAERAADRNDKSAAFHVARALTAIRREHWPLAVADLDEAAKLDPSARRALALLDVRLGRYDSALDLLAKEPATYDVEVARGASLRGLGKLAEAEAAHRRAIALDAARPEAHYDLALVLAHDRATFAKAADEFRLAGATELADRYAKLAK